MKTQFILIVCVSSVVMMFCPQAIAEEARDGGGDWWNIPYPEPFDSSQLESGLGFIHVDGNRFVDEAGNIRTFHGVNVSDPDKLEKDGRWSKAYFQVIKDWGADIVRVPVHPIAWRGRGKAAYFELLDQAVTWASELDLYLIIEWHSIGNLATGVFQHPMYDTTEQETYNFWRDVSYRYAGIPVVAIYEIFNEPTMYRGQLGHITWSEWREINEQIIGIIFAHDPRVIPLVAGFDWAYELRQIREYPIRLAGIGYVSHPYPMKAPQTWEENWERDFGYVADTYPVFATEIGFTAADDPGAQAPFIGDEEYGRRVLAYLEAKGISWVACCFDPDQAPQLISDWDYTPTTQGSFFRACMLGED